MRAVYLIARCALCTAALNASSVLAEDARHPSSIETTHGFTVTIDGTDIAIDPGETVQATMKDGRTVTVGLTRNPFAKWSDPMLSFDYPSNLTVATQKLSDNITQHLLATAVGTMIIVQEYSGVDPTTLREFMMGELTREDVQIGAELVQSETVRTLNSGMTLKGLEAVVKSGVEVKTVDVLTFGRDRQGVVLVTIILDERRPTDQAFIDKFWSTLVLKF